uniref:Uncharacterized protein n=1 Tax=Anopheles dirus TaxID=7168 RepID=A0A182NVZ8_9DIPT
MFVRVCAPAFQTKNKWAFGQEATVAAESSRRNY